MSVEQRGKAADVRLDAPPAPLAAPGATRPAEAARATPVTSTGRDPLQRYAVLCLAADLGAVLLALSIGYAARWILPDDPSGLDVQVVPVAVLAGALWLTVLWFRGAYDTRFLGVGSEEFKRVLVATFWVFGSVAAISFLCKLDLSRGFVLISLLVGIVLLLTGRWLLRTWLGRRRMRGQFQHRTLVVGDPARSRELREALHDPVNGFSVDAMLGPPASNDVGMTAWLDEAMDTIASHRIDAVAIADSAAMSSEAVRRLAWRLEGPRIDLLVAPTLGDVFGPRVSVRPAAGLPLLHLDEPQLTGPKRGVKRVYDLVIGTATLLVLSPLLLLIAASVGLSSRGGVFYTQERVGQGGRIFRFLKFRTMVAGADGLRDTVIGEPDADIADRYRNDPRVTRVGRVLRRWSLDELPQLVNVVGGSMSLVGPRPMLVDELPLLDDTDHRRHLTKPGITGLWQVSGRKEVPWDERMRLDLDYVDKWSLPLDVVIMAKTIKAVLVGHGAY